MITEWNPISKIPKHNERIDILVKTFNTEDDEFLYYRICDVFHNAYQNDHHEKWGIRNSKQYRVVGWMPLPEISKNADPTNT